MAIQDFEIIPATNADITEIKRILFGTLRKYGLRPLSPLREAISLYRKYGFKEMNPTSINDRVDQAFELNLTDIYIDE